MHLLSKVGKLCGRQFWCGQATPCNDAKNPPCRRWKISRFLFEPCFQRQCGSFGDSIPDTAINRIEPARFRIRLHLLVPFIICVRHKVREQFAVFARR